MPNLTTEEKLYIRQNFQTQTVPDVAKALNRGAATIYEYYKENGLKAFKTPQDPKPRHHPFRKANRRLEAVVIKRRIENRTANPK